MGLRVYIHRSSLGSELNLFEGVDVVTVINIEGPFEPDENAPAAVLVERHGNKVITTPEFAEVSQNDKGCVMFGGDYGATTDSRFRKAVGFYGAVPIHDRFETWEEYEAYSV